MNNMKSTMTDFGYRRKILRNFTTCQTVDIPFLYSDALHTYLSHSSTLNVGVVVVGVGELCLLTRWFKDVSCTLSRFPCIALLWFANFSLFMGEPRTTRGHDASTLLKRRTFKEHDSFQWRKLSADVVSKEICHKYFNTICYSLSNL